MHGRVSQAAITGKVARCDQRQHPPHTRHAITNGVSTRISSHRVCNKLTKRVGRTLWDHGKRHPPNTSASDRSADARHSSASGRHISQRGRCLRGPGGALMGTGARKLRTCICSPRGRHSIEPGEGGAQTRLCSAAAGCEGGHGHDPSAQMIDR